MVQSLEDGLLGRAISAPAPATTRPVAIESRTMRQPNEVKPRSEPVARFHKEPVGRFSNDQASIAEQGRTPSRAPRNARSERNDHTSA
eukprot:297459-Amphidinium_carterae.1